MSATHYILWKMGFSGRIFREAAQLLLQSVAPKNAILGNPCLNQRR